MKTKKKTYHLFILSACLSIICLVFASSHSHGKNHENSRTEELKASLINLMDKVLESPDDRKTSEKINQTAKMLIEEEKKEINRHRLLLVKKISAIKREKKKIEKSRKSDIKKWLKLSKKVRRGFSEMNEIENNINLYKNFFLTTPLYSGMTKLFDKKNSEIKKYLRLYLKKSYSFWLPTKEKLAPKDIATAVFAHKSASDISDIHTNSSFVQETMKNMRELDEIEILIKNRLIDMDEMLNFFLYRKYSACAETAQKILEYDYGNMEAFFYRKRAQYHLNKEMEFKKSNLLASLPDAPETKIEIFNETPKVDKKIKKRKISKKRPKITKKRNLVKRPAKKTKTKISAPTKNIPKKARIKKRIFPASPKPPAAKSKKKDFLESAPTAHKKTARPKKASENDIIKKAQDYYVLGVKHYALGNMEKAKEYFKKCVKINPKHTKAKKAMERILKEQK